MNVKNVDENCTTHRDTHINTHIQAHAHTHIHTYTYTYTHIHTYTHTHYHKIRLAIHVFEDSKQVPAFGVFFRRDVD